MSTDKLRYHIDEYLYKLRDVLDGKIHGGSSYDIDKTYEWFKNREDVFSLLFKKKYIVIINFRKDKPIPQEYSFNCAITLRGVWALYTGKIL